MWLESLTLSFLLQNLFHSKPHAHANAFHNPASLPLTAFSASRLTLVHNTWALASRVSPVLTFIHLCTSAPQLLPARIPPLKELRVSHLLGKHSPVPDPPASLSAFYSLDLPGLRGYCVYVCLLLHFHRSQNPAHTPSMWQSLRHCIKPGNYT